MLYCGHALLAADMLYYSLQAKLLPTATYTYDLQREEKDENEKRRGGEKKWEEVGGGGAKRTSEKEGASLAISASLAVRWYFRPPKPTTSSPIHIYIDR